MLVHYVVRHGEALPGAPDCLRRLSGRGRDDVERVARHVAALGVRIAGIRHSGLVRARETAEILAAHLRPGAGVDEADGLAPDADPAEARRVLEGAREPLALVGHLPHLARLTSLLLAEDPGVEIVRFEPGTMAALAWTGEAWAVAWVLSPAVVAPRPGTP